MQNITYENLLIGLMFILLCFFYSILFYRFQILKKENKEIKSKNILFQKYFNSIEESKLNNEESIHKENFIKFLSDSRDWAYQYIEDVQFGLEKFSKDIKPEIDYFKEYGDLTSMQPNYYSLKKISEAYDELIKLLPKEENK